MANLTGFTQGPTVDPADYLDQRTLILGEINTGKTTLTARILEALRARRGDHELVVLDLAPAMPANSPRAASHQGVGGRLLAPGQEGGLLYLHPCLAPPRLSSSSEEEAALAAQRNLAIITPFLETMVRSRRPILLVNDVTLYLQAGSAEDLMSCLSQVRTVVANGYYGNKLGTGALSQREKQEMQALMTHFSRLITLTDQAWPAVSIMEDES